MQVSGARDGTLICGESHPEAIENRSVTGSIPVPGTSNFRGLRSFDIDCFDRCLAGVPVDSD
jgi:hypothetical protein